MKAYLAIKYYEDSSNKVLIEELYNVLKDSGYETIVLTKDFEEFGKREYSPEDLMKLAFSLIDKSDVLFVELSEKGVGLGIESGYAYAKNIPIVILAKEGKEISNTIKGIAQKIIFYKSPADIKEKLA